MRRDGIKRTRRHVGASFWTGIASDALADLEQALENA
jgi:hypothetical protein